MGDLENNVVAIERILEYSQTESEVQTLSHYNVLLQIEITIAGV